MIGLQVFLFCGLLILLGWILPRTPPRGRRLRYTELGYVIHGDVPEEDPALIEAYFTDVDPLGDDDEIRVRD